MMRNLIGSCAPALVSSLIVVACGGVPRGAAEPVQIIYPTPLAIVSEAEEQNTPLVIPGVKAVEMTATEEIPAQVERYPGVNLTALPEDAQQITIRLLKKGFSHEAISGILANIARETGGSYDPVIINSIGAVGLCQWLGVRAQKLYQQDDWSTIGGQVDYLVEELATTESGVDLTGSAYECGYRFARDFERTGITSTYSDRGYLAEEIYAAVFE